MNWKNIIVIFISSSALFFWLFPFWKIKLIPTEERNFQVSIPEVSRDFTKDFLIDFIGFKLTLPFFDLCLTNRAFGEIDGNRISDEEFKKIMPDGLRVNILDKVTGSIKPLLANLGETECLSLRDGTEIERSDFSASFLIPIDLKKPSAIPDRFNLNSSPIFIRNNYLALFGKFVLLFVAVGFVFANIKGFLRLLIKDSKYIKRKDNKEAFFKKREYEWLVVSQSYLQCALMNARILREKLSNFAITIDSPLDFCIKKIYGNYPQDCEYLVFPIIFNFKHGIEIYLKAITGMKNSEFVKEHNLSNLLKNIVINDSKMVSIINKYAFSRLLLPLNNKCDTKNEFERYPQGGPYDNLTLFPAVNSSGQIENEPLNTGFDDYIKWMQENNLEIKSLITEEKIDELIKDIEFFILGLRKISN